VSCLQQSFSSAIFSFSVSASLTRPPSLKRFSTSHQVELNVGEVKITYTFALRIWDLDSCGAAPFQLNFFTTLSARFEKVSSPAKSGGRCCILGAGGAALK
jgi:hypothetical protein